MTFTVHLKNPKAATIADGGESIEVSLYNTNEAETRNLATMTYLPDAEDASDRLVMSEEAFAPAEGDTIQAEVVETEEELPEAVDVVPTLGDAAKPMARTFVYEDALQFGNNKGTWKDYARIAGTAPGGSDDVSGYASADSRQDEGKGGSTGTGSTENMWILRKIREEQISAMRIMDGKSRQTIRSTRDCTSIIYMINMSPSM